jgi:ketosteroid isomerase-like protein
MKRIFLMAATASLLLSCGNNASQPEAPATVSAADATAPPPTEIGDAALMDMGKAGLANLSKGDVAAWMNDFADNAVYQWNNGDSLAGKAAILAYWTDRRQNALDTILFSHDIWLPLKVNQPQNDRVAPGTWLLSWYQVDATYQTGNKMTQWIHTTMHLNEAGKIDRVIQYLDRVPINKAMGAK